MRDAMIEFLKATLSAGFCTKNLYFSCMKNYKELKNHHFFTHPTDLTYWKCLSFNKFSKFCGKKNVKTRLYLGLYCIRFDSLYSVCKPVVGNSGRVFSLGWTGAGGPHPVKIDQSLPPSDTQSDTRPFLLDQTLFSPSQICPPKLEKKKKHRFTLIMISAFVGASNQFSKKK